MPKLRGHRFNATLRHRSSTYKHFITNEKFLNEVETRRLLNSFDLIGDDDDNDRILENTMLTEADFDVVDDCVVQAQINSINECFTLIIDPESICFIRIFCIEAFDL
jgi:hypothetical protein